MSDRPSTVRVIVVHPDLLGTYGDGGNGVVLAQRLRWRGIPVELVEAMSGLAVPASGDIYCLGGGEDAAQARAAAELADGDPLARAVANGAAVLAVCAGFQVMGKRFAAADGSYREGLNLLDIETTKGRGRRPVGELVVDPMPMGLPELTGYENHGGVTSLGPAATPLGAVTSGTGNGAGDGSEGAVTGRIVGTYMHGPVLARNPALADCILEWVVGPLAPLDDSAAESLRMERLMSARAGVPGAGYHPLVRARSALRRWSRAGVKSY